MALWLALALPALPLQLAARALDAQTASALPLVVTDGPAQRPVVAFCNAAARQAGVQRGLKLAAAQALTRDLIALPRQPEREAEALHELACWGYQFSAAVVPQHIGHAQGLLLEIGGSLRLFGGRTLLLRRLQTELAGLGLRAHAGLAPTPRGAWWIALARGAGQATVRDALAADELTAALDPLPLALPGWDAGTHDTLRTLGLATLADLRRLPRAAVRRRFAAALLDDLDRAYGAVPDPQPPFAPPERFVAGIELPADLIDATLLMIPAERLLRSLEGFLRGRDAGATELLFEAMHSPRRAQPVPPTPITLALAAPERDAARLVKLLTERLTRVQLPAPAIALRLTVARLQRFAVRHGSLLPPSPGDAAGSDDHWLRLAETLHARLGSERVFQLQPVDDHRPEHAQRRMPLSVGVSAAAPSLTAPKAAARASAAGRSAGRSAGGSVGHSASQSAGRATGRLAGHLAGHLAGPPVAGPHAALAGPPASPAGAACAERIEHAPASHDAPAAADTHAIGGPLPRPLLLLPAPQPLSPPAGSSDTPAYGGPLTLIAGPERIEAGWWDLGRTDRAAGAVHRDYFVARNPHGQVLWVFRDLAAPRGWFLHGFFA
jgi:protein ImuB